MVPRPCTRPGGRRWRRRSTRARRRTGPVAEVHSRVRDHQRAPQSSTAGFGAQLRVLEGAAPRSGPRLNSAAFALRLHAEARVVEGAHHVFEAPHRELLWAGGGGGGASVEAGTSGVGLLLPLRRRFGRVDLHASGGRLLPGLEAGRLHLREGRLRGFSAGAFFEQSATAARAAPPRVFDPATSAWPLRREVEEEARRCVCRAHGVSATVSSVTRRRPSGGWRRARPPNLC